MRLRLLVVGAVIGIPAWAGPAQAQSTVTAPGVRVVTDPSAPGGPRVAVKAPLVRVWVGHPPPQVVVPAYPPVILATAVPQAVPVPPPAPPVAVPPPPPPVPVTPVPEGRPQTLREFASTFRPAPGTWQATLLHPRTGAPVTVTFTLPAGTPRVIVGPRALEFDYGRTSVVIVFTVNGGARVRTL